MNSPPQTAIGWGPGGVPSTTWCSPLPQPERFKKKKTKTTQSLSDKVLCCIPRSRLRALPFFSSLFTRNWSPSSRVPPHGAALPHAPGGSITCPPCERASLRAACTVSSYCAAVDLVSPPGNWRDGSGESHSLWSKPNQVFPKTYFWLWEDHVVPGIESKVSACKVCTPDLWASPWPWTSWLYFCGTGDWTQGFIHMGCMLYHWATSPPNETFLWWGWVVDYIHQCWGLLLEVLRGLCGAVDPTQELQGKACSLAHWAILLARDRLLIFCFCWGILLFFSQKDNDRLS